MPLIKPPTPEQIEQDKADITTQFDRAFTLIEQLATDTEALKAAETERNNKLDVTIKDVEQVVSDLRTANERREQENRRIADDVNRLRDSIPKALDSWKTERDERLQELSQELKSLKTLMSNRLQPTPSTSSGTMAPPASASLPKTNGAPASTNGSSTTTATQAAPAPAVDIPASQTTAEVSAPAPSVRPNKAAIPTWQMAATRNADKSTTS